MAKWVLTLRLGLTVIAVLFFSACSDNENISGLVISKSEPSQPYKFSSLQSEQTYQVLLAEYHYHQADYKSASHIYNKLLLTQADARVAERATELAVKIEDYDQALIAAEQWKLLEPDSSEIDQFLVLLYQEKKDYLAAAKVLTNIVASYSTGKAKPVDVAVALLEQQKETKHAYHTFHYYLQDPSQESQKENSHYRYYLALFAMRAGLFKEVIDETDSLALIENKEIQRKTALLRVKAFTALDKADLALETLKKLIAEAADPVTKQNYARMMASLGQAEKAVALLEQAYDDHPDKAELLLDMIAISLDNDQYEQTLGYVDQLKQIKGQEDKAHYFKGLVFEAQKQFSAALKEYSLVSEANVSLQLHTRVVMTLKELEGIESALSYLHEKQKESSSQDVEMRADLYILESEMLRQQGKFEDALLLNVKAEKLLPNDLDILYSQALLYEDTNQIKKSEKVLHRILWVDKDHSAALNALGYMLSVHTTRYDEAYGYIKKAYELRPNDPAIIDSLGWVAYRKGDLKDAERYLRTAYKKLQDPEVASHLVEVLSKQGQQEEADKLLTEMLVKHPENKQLIAIKALINKDK